MLLLSCSFYQQEGKLTRQSAVAWQEAQQEITLDRVELAREHLYAIPGGWTGEKWIVYRVLLSCDLTFPH